MTDTPTQTRDLLVVNPRGFCAGVERAIEVVDRLLRTVGTPLYVRKEIVHNKAVVEDFRRRGVVFVDELDEVPDGRTVVFSAHGIAPSVQRRGAPSAAYAAVDATCPLVTKVHQEVVRHVKRRSQDGADRACGSRRGTRAPWARRPASIHPGDQASRMSPPWTFPPDSARWPTRRRPR